MLDTETKRRIDTARNILVGKIPDPKSQVEQITIALIYKFMDDMDAESEEFGGERKFFAGEFGRYGWAKLMRSGLGGHETLNLYAEAITRMPENPGIPLLFRDIFKNAYLPYRDPETLRAFLKIIDEFTYDHSERLGDAFEYLLSVLGSQGDAGQFRTPRHIIDFMVEIVDPKKTETVLDPACGTAGFLISSYKHILNSNKDEKGNSTLTPDEKGRLAQNFRGYDISPDMVRLSLVNMYLHGFVDPHISEYDTLTSLDHWNDYADVILANPPFMSPQGGIKPHNRFSVQSKRSEVLFVDYMAEHLTANGRAGIIVPEGIIFQSGTAYKQLRKMLVENYLVAVISLPAGVFNPYSGVKTSILILDRDLAKKSDTIGFFKVENDGFGLGAQRREIDRNDLPQVQSELGEYLHYMKKRNIEEFNPEFGLIVKKEKISLNEFNLNKDGYLKSEKRSSVYPFAELGDLVEIFDSKRKPITKHERKPGIYPYYGATGILDFVEGYLFDEALVLVGEDGAKWGAGEQTAFAVQGKIWVNNHAHVLKPKRDMILDRYLIEILNDTDLTPYITGVTVHKLNREKLRNIKIPLPPLDVQQEIVAEIEGYQKIIDGARAVIDNYRPHIPIHPDWPLVELGEVFIKSDQTILPELIKTQVNYIGLENISQGTGELLGNIISQEPKEIKSLKNLFEIGDILYGKLRPNLNKVWFSDREGICSTDIFVIKPKTELVNPSFYANYFRSESFNSRVLMQIKGAQLPRVGWSTFSNILIPLPSFEIQQTIVAEIEAEQALVNANRELITRFEKKIQATLARVWGEE
ncbi:MAG: N-6 DNA methylase [Leptolinea sp.]|nr:N-6 DNA methylase [Leptolinea sp.]